MSLIIDNMLHIFTEAIHTTYMEEQGVLVKLALDIN